jgi:hypothetical protein
VIIHSEAGEVLRRGELITFTCELIGFDGLEVSYQWECDMGEGFQPVPGATEAAYSFVADADTLGAEWRVIVSILEPEDNPANE